MGLFFFFNTFCICTCIFFLSLLFLKTSVLYTTNLYYLRVTLNFYLYLR